MKEKITALAQKCGADLVGFAPNPPLGHHALDLILQQHIHAVAFSGSKGVTPLAGFGTASQEKKRWYDE